jgi:hypothetical protein
MSLGFRNGTMIFAGLILLTWLARRAGAGLVLTFWIAYVLTRPLGASLGDLLTQSKDFGGLDLGASTTSLLFFGVIVVLVAREQVLASRHGVAVKGAGPIGGRRRDLAWAIGGVAAIAIIGGGFSSRPAGQPTAAGPKTIVVGEAHPTTQLGDLSSFAAITADVQAKVARNDLAGGRARVKDLEVSWDDAEAGLKPRDPARWHQLDDEIDAVLTSLRAGHPVKAECATSLAALTTTINRFDGV